MKRLSSWAGVVLLLLAGACAPPRAVPSPAGAEFEPSAVQLPPIPTRSGPLAIRVMYPGEGATLGVRDSTFIFGNTGTGEASLTINGVPVEVAPNGAFLAFLPVSMDGVYQLAASAGGETDRLIRRVGLPIVPAPAVPGRLSVVAGSVMPRGAFTLEEGEPVEIRVRGTPGAYARLVLPDSTIYPLMEHPARDRAQAFMLDRDTEASGVSEYVGHFPARAIAVADTLVGTPTVAPLLDAGTGARGAFIELNRGSDTIRVPLRASIAVLPAGAPRVAVAASERTDRLTIGTAVAGGGTPYHWFFPVGTRLAITGERGGEYRVRLTDDLSVWVDASEVRLLAPGTPAPGGTVGTVRATSYPGFIDIRLSTSDRLPFRVDGSERGLTVTVYGAESRTNWLQYGTSDPFLQRMTWEQPADDRYQLHIELAEPLWGYLPFYDADGDLIIRVRRPPEIDPNRPLEGLYIGVDAGHPPGGAIGPTGLTEAEANLAISRALIPMLEAAGARVLEIRPGSSAVALGARPRMATDSSVHLLVSIHNNAFPDGVNPWESAGTSVFYNRWQSLGLARSLQHELLREFGLRDLGIARADLALTRPTWMPAALTETMFLMIPQQEAALRDPEVHERIARAHLRGIQAFLRGRVARGQR